MQTPRGLQTGHGDAEASCPVACGGLKTKRAFGQRSVSKQSSAMNDQYAIAFLEMILLGKVDYGIEQFTRVHDIGGYAVGQVDIIHKIKKRGGMPGISAEMVVEIQMIAPAAGMTLNITVKLISRSVFGRLFGERDLKAADADALLFSSGIDDAGKSSSRAYGAGYMRIPLQWRQG